MCYTTDDGAMQNVVKVPCVNISCDGMMNTYAYNKNLYQYCKCEKCGTDLKMYKVKGYISDHSQIIRIPLSDKSNEDYKIIRKDFFGGVHIEVFYGDSLSDVKSTNNRCNILYEKHHLHKNVCSLCYFDIDKVDFCNAKCNDCKFLKQIERLERKKKFFSKLSLKHDIKKLIKERQSEMIKKEEEITEVKPIKKKTLADRFINYISADEGVE